MCIIETATTKKVISFYGKNCGGPTETVHTCPDTLIRPCITLKSAI